MKKFFVFLLIILSMASYAQSENVINMGAKKGYDTKKYSYIYKNLKDTEKYNGHFSVYSFENLKKDIKFERYFKENGKFVNKETDYKITSEKDLCFHGLKIQNILIKVYSEYSNSKTAYREDAVLLADKNNKILMYFEKICDYKFFPDKLMILHCSENGIGVMYICYEKNKPFWGYDVRLPKFISGHTGTGIIEDAEILAENYIKCSDYQYVTEVYRVMNSKYDYEKNSKKAEKLKAGKIQAFPERMKLIWFRGKRTHQKSSHYDFTSHDFANSQTELDMSELIK